MSTIPVEASVNHLEYTKAFNILGEFCVLHLHDMAPRETEAMVFGHYMVLSRGFPGADKRSTLADTLAGNLVAHGAESELAYRRMHALIDWNFDEIADLTGLMPPGYQAPWLLETKSGIRRFDRNLLARAVLNMVGQNN